MSGSLLGLVATCGALLLGGLALALLGLRRAPARLDDALAALDGDQRATSAWRSRLPMLPGQEKVLQLQGRSAADLAGQKLLYAALAAAVPAIVGTLWWLVLGTSMLLPVGGTLLGAGVGFFLPDVLLRARAGEAREDAGEALFTFLDLVTLERLANASGSQALAAAASMSDVPLFARIRETLDRARLEQRAPYDDLKRLGVELGLPELGDVADVMRLDEHGASLAGSLRARVHELRDAHLTRTKVAAHAVSERMTVWMVLPAIVFGLVFLAPPLLRMAGA